MIKSINLLYIVVVIVLVAITSFNVIQKNQSENEVIALKTELKAIEKEVELLVEDEEVTDTSEETLDTLDEDIAWFTTEVYTLENRKQLYEAIEVSATDPVLEALFGEDLPPEEHQGTVHSIDRTIENIDVYGKYIDENTYQAVVTFDLSFEMEEKTDRAFTIMQVELTKQDDRWKVSHFEEYAKGARQ